MSTAFDAYIRPDGTPQFEESCVLFWDLLGVRAHSVDHQALTQLVNLSAALEKARERALFEDRSAAEIHAVTWFTDNVVVGTPVQDYVTIEQALGYTAMGAGYMQLLMIDAGFLGRGAITFGNHHMQKALVFGPALIEAVELEKATRWPRIALSSRAAELNREVVRTLYSDPMDSPHADEYLVDEHGTVFVDHLGVWLGEEDDEAVAESNLSRLRQVIEDALGREAAAPWSDEHAGEVFHKWKWLADMHNHVLNERSSYRDFRIRAGEPRHTFRSFISTL